jgi:phosphoribosylanthranilate isomerase
MSLWVKICANTSLEDARLAAEAGADAVGFVFAPSPRRMTPEQVAAIVPHLPANLEKIGVFVDVSLEESVTTVETAGLTGVQLHFNASPEMPARLRERFGPALRILRVLHFDADRTVERLVSEPDLPGSPATGLGRWGGLSRAEDASTNLRALASEVAFPDSNIDAILVDSRTATAVGGTGKTFDWSTASKTLFQNTNVRTRLIAAGGLTPGNVAEAIAILQPWGVDVVSGVEAEPGRKDPAKVRAFIINARKAYAERTTVAQSE